MPVQPTHVWVTAGPGRPPYPGILLDWRQDKDGIWEGLTVWAAFHLTHPVLETELHQKWVLASNITKR
jgi:hypothetical protein